MKFAYRTFGVCASVAILTSCRGQSPIPAGAVSSAARTPQVPQWQATRTAHAACSQDRPGEPTCLALIINAKQQPNVAGWPPADLQARYELPSKLKGNGRIVAIVDIYDNPKVAADLAVYRKHFGLGPAKFTKYNQYGQTKNYPDGSTSWGVEIDLDAQMVSAACPKCTIDLVEASAAAPGPLDTAEAEAVKLGAHIVSNSWICYGSLTCVNESDFAKPGVTYLAAAGDRGLEQPGAPMAFESVASIGGTVLSKAGAGYRETGWSGSGGGCVTAVLKPSWQHDKICSWRLTNDASAVAWNVAVYDSYGYRGWITVGGTSISTPLLAGAFALAGNGGKQEGGRTFWLASHHQGLYNLCGLGCLFGQYSFGIGWGSPDGIGAF